LTSLYCTKCSNIEECVYHMAHLIWYPVTTLPRNQWKIWWMQTSFRRPISIKNSHNRLFNLSIRRSTQHGVLRLFILSQKIANYCTSLYTMLSPGTLSCVYSSFQLLSPLLQLTNWNLKFRNTYSFPFLSLLLSVRILLPKNLLILWPISNLLLLRNSGIFLQLHDP